MDIKRVLYATTEDSSRCRPPISLAIANAQNVTEQAEDVATDSPLLRVDRLVMIENGAASINLTIFNWFIIYYENAALVVWQCSNEVTSLTPLFWWKSI